MKKNIYIKNEKGMVLVLTIIVLMVLMIIFGAVMTILGGNIRQVKHQENMMRAHYVALSGINIASTALFEAVGSETLVDKYFKGPLPRELQDTITLPTGEAEVTLTAEDISGVRWIRVKSIGTLSDNSAKRTLVLRINADIPAIQEWSNN